MAFGVFGACALVITVLGTRITRVVDHLADRTGVGEALAGAVLLGVSTSLAGAVVSITAASKGSPELAVSNALGGIAVQTFFLAVADFAYRRANLEHAAASAPNMLQNALLITLLSIIVLAPHLPGFTIWGIHPVTPVMFILYLFGMNMVRGARLQPMWRPSVTDETREDEPQEDSFGSSMTRLWLSFGALMLGLGLAGWLLEPAAGAIARGTGLGFTGVGVLFTATSTSIPELVTSVAAVRRGALALAVGGIIGGNAFDTLFTAASDLAYREGSIYHAIPPETRFWVVLTLVMSSVLMMGLIRRQEQGFAGIGTESAAVIVLYGLGLALLFASVL